MSLLYKMKQPRLLSVTLLLVTLVIGIVIGSILNTGVRADKQNPPVAPDATPLTVPAGEPASNEFSKLAKKLEPSVVYIESDYLPKPGVKRSHPGNGDDEDDEDTPQAQVQPQDPSDMLKKFFGGQQQQPQPDPRSFRQEGTGTGFIVDRNGYILTNYHVVEKADRVKVKINGDDNEYKGRVIGYDQETDVAVLKIDAKHSLTPVHIGNSDSVEVGDWAIAIGSPFGLQATVTAGIVSATGRDLPNTQFQHFLQTDAAINPGNSGGPLLNIRGEVIGINTMIATQSGTYSGIGFALPSNMVARVYNDIIRDGRVVRGSIGIQWSKDGSQTDTLQAFGLDHGVLVEVVSPTGPAGKAGLKPDDIVVALNSRPVKNGDELTDKVAGLPIGSSATLTVDRNGKKMDFNVNVEERTVVWKDRLQAAQLQPGVRAEPPKAPSGHAEFGITIMHLTPKERSDMSISDNTGVKVTEVDPGSLGDDLGMQEGDVILSINRTPVASPEDVKKIGVTLKPGQAVAVHVARSARTVGHSAPAQRIYLSGRVPAN
ncbi:MAG TPA: Do family serine endopeptidase [Bryobacteraceae bacterium]|jgi:serine protease Do|nr:Do family serine endopeptidase [Bryobacteraceae bacterium]